MCDTIKFWIWGSPFSEKSRTKNYKHSTNYITTICSRLKFSICTYTNTSHVIYYLELFTIRSYNIFLTEKVFISTTTIYFLCVKSCDKNSVFLMFILTVRAWNRDTLKAFFILYVILDIIYNIRNIGLLNLVVANLSSPPSSTACHHHHLLKHCAKKIV